MSVKEIKSNHLKVISLRKESRVIFKSKIGVRFFEVIKDDENTMSSIKALLIILQVFGYMPLNGITSKDPYDLKFNWISLKSFYVIWNFICGLFILIMGGIDSATINRTFTQQFCIFKKTFNIKCNTKKSNTSFICS